MFLSNSACSPLLILISAAFFPVALYSLSLSGINMYCWRCDWLPLTGRNVWETAKILVLGPYLCTKIWVRAMIGLFKMPFHVDLPIKVKGNSKCSSSNSFSPLGRQNKDIGAALQTLLTEVKLRLRRRLLVWWCKRGQPCLHQLHVQGFRGGHSLRLAFRLCFPSFHSSLFIFHWYISMIGALFQWLWCLLLEGAGLPAMGA